jgi:arylsulfatase A-like enzyme
LGRLQNYQGRADQPWQLFNIKEDLSETNDLASERPDLVKKMSEPFNLKRAEIQGDVERGTKQKAAN